MTLEEMRTKLGTPEGTEEVRALLWANARYGNLLQSCFAASIIRQLGLSGPDGQDPDDA